MKRVASIFIFIGTMLIIFGLFCIAGILIEFTTILFVPGLTCTLIGYILFKIGEEINND